MEVDAPCVEPDRRRHDRGAGRRARRATACRAWAGSRPTARRTVRRDHRHVHVETLVVGGGAAGVPAARDGRRRAGRSLVDARRRRATMAHAGEVAPDADVLDAGHRARRLRRRLRGGLPAVASRRARLARARPARGARDRRARTTDRVRRRRPARRDAGLVRPDVRSIASACCRASAPWCSRRTTAGTTRRSRSRTRASRSRRSSTSGRRAARRPTPRERAGSTCAADGRSPGPRATRAYRAVHARGSGWRAGDRRRRPAARGRRLEPGRPALARRSAAACATTSRAPASSPTAPGPRGWRSWAPPPATGSHRHAVLVHAGRRLSPALRGPAARRDRRRRAGRRGARPALDRAREARDLHRHGDRPGTDDAAC